MDLFCGFTENVSTPYSLTFTKNDLRFIAGSGKTVLWYVSLLIFFILGPHIGKVPRSSRTSKTCASQDWPHSRFTISTCGMAKSSIAAGYSPLYFSSFLASQTPTPTLFPVFIRPIMVTGKAPAIPHLHNASESYSVPQGKLQFT
jgi:hypothetical protein